MTSDRDRLIELLEVSVYGNIDIYDGFIGPEVNCENIADYLLANGVRVIDTKFINPKNRELITHFAGMPINDVLDLARAKKEGKLIVPPCKVGDKVYYINRYYHIELKKDTIYEAKVVRIVTTSLGTSLVIQIRGEWGCIQQSNIDCIETPDVKDFDRTVFLTKEEAEEKLKELGK